jgi:hypothetical protein
MKSEFNVWFGGRVAVPDSSFLLLLTLVTGWACSRNSGHFSVCALRVGGGGGHVLYVAGVRPEIKRDGRPMPSSAWAGWGGVET